MKLYKTCLVALLACLMFSCSPYRNWLTGARKYKLPYAMVKASEMCGEKEGCTPGSTGKEFHFTKNPYSPSLTGVSGARQIAFSILGRAVMVNKDGGSVQTDRIPLPCADNGESSFTDDDITTLEADGGIGWTKEVTKNLELDVQAAVSTSLDKLKAAGVSVTQLAEARGKLEAAYSKLNNQALGITSTYSAWGLNDDALIKLTQNTKHCKCKEFLLNNSTGSAYYKVITAIGLVNYTLTYDNQTLDVIASELQAELAKSGVNVDMTTKFKKEISKKFAGAIENGYQVVVYRLASARDLTVGEAPAICKETTLSKDCRWLAPTDRTVQSAMQELVPTDASTIFNVSCSVPELAGKKVRGKLKLIYNAAPGSDGTYGFTARLTNPDGSVYEMTQSTKGEDRINYQTDPYTVPADGHLNFKLQLDRAWNDSNMQPLTIRAGSFFQVVQE